MTPAATYHNVIDINETLVSLSTQLLDKRNGTRTEVTHLDFRIHQFAAQTLEYALLRHDLLSVLKVVGSTDLEVLSCQSDPPILSIHRIVTLFVTTRNRQYQLPVSRVLLQVEVGTRIYTSLDVNRRRLGGLNSLSSFHLRLFFENLLLL